MDFKFKGNHQLYWETCLHLLINSKAFFLISLYKWDPIFYKCMKLYQIRRLLRDYKTCVTGKKEWNLRQI